MFRFVGYWLLWYYVMMWPMFPGGRGCYFLFGIHVKPPCGYRYFKVSEKSSPRYFSLVIEKKGSDIDFFPFSNKLILDEENAQTASCNNLRICKMIIPHNPLFFGHKYVQHAFI